LPSGGDGEDEGGDEGTALNRSEKKARKAMAKLGLKPEPSVARVTFRRAPDVLFVIAAPDVFKSPSAQTYVIFGEAKIEDLSARAKAAAAAQFSRAGGPDLNSVPAASAYTGRDEEVDEAGLEAKDVDLVIAQASCTRAQAVKALKQNHGDIVHAIMDLTST